MNVQWLKNIIEKLNFSFSWQKGNSTNIKASHKVEIANTTKIQMQVGQIVQNMYLQNIHQGLPHLPEVKSILTDLPDPSREQKMIEVRQASAGVFFEGMSYDDFSNLKGADMILQRVDKLVATRGIPSMILDHGITIGKLPGITTFGEYKVNLTDGDWNLTYHMPEQMTEIELQIKKAHPNCGNWINPKPIMPGAFFGLSALSFYSFWVPEPNGTLEGKHSHLILCLAGTFTKPIPLANIVAKEGDPVVTTVDDEYRRVKRYWVVHRDERGYPIHLYSVDFELLDGDSHVSVYRIYAETFAFVNQELQRIQKEFNQSGELDTKLNP